MKDEKQKLYSFICKKTDIFSSLEIKLFEKEPSLKNKKLNYFVDDKRIDISKTIEQNNIADSSIIFFKKEEDNNEDKEISVIIRSSDQRFTSSFICKRSDNFKELEQKIYKRFPDLMQKEHYFLCNGNIITIEKTIEENNINDGNILVINYIEENEDICVNIKSSEQNIEFSIKCKKSDKFKDLVEKFYEKYTDLKNEQHHFVYNENKIDIEKTLEQNKIKDNDIIIYNNGLFDKVI